ncbi:hypothetical protein [Dyella subtropica]|uniref:hypothetical protein n=1 Tax=Dyella subtropica TaxID=2992127 RepID=UPI00225A9834|nr:hypothetical protein [Dyella subtropica]
MSAFAQPASPPTGMGNSSPNVQEANTGVVQDSPGTGLGQSWPNAPDVSANPHWHVYVFERDGIRYVQVNDLGGKVRAAFATANGELLVLPMGEDAQVVIRPQGDRGRSNQTRSVARTETIYQDGMLRITARSRRMDAVLMEAVLDVCTDPVQCGGRFTAQ